MRIRCEAVLAICLAASPGIATKAQELLESPAPANDQAMLRLSITKASSKRGEIAFLPKPAFREPWWKLDKDVTALGIIHAAASLMDGVSTRQSPNEFHEADPADRLFLGREPTWSRMILLGTLEIFGTALLAQRMKHSRWKVARRLYVAPQIVLIGMHTYAGGHNVVLTSNYLASR